MIVLQANSLTKTYGKLTAVDNLSLEIKGGEIYGFLGLNGAGKTTTIRMLLDMVKPSSGSALLFGKRVTSGDELLNKVGFLVETPYSYPDLTVVENLRIYFDYRKLKDGRLIETAIHNLHLYKYRNVKAKHLSLGNKQRLGLAKALFHNPRLLILDEPTNGLDPAGIVEIRSLFKTLASEGVTVFISSHILTEISKLATRIGIIHEGKLIREVLTIDLENELRKSLVIKAGDIKKCLLTLATWGYSFSMNENADAIYSINEKPAHESEIIASRLVQAGVGIKELFIEREDLESYFLRQIATEKIR